MENKCLFHRAIIGQLTKGMAKRVDLKLLLHLPTIHLRFNVVIRMIYFFAQVTVTYFINPLYSLTTRTWVARCWLQFPNDGAHAWANYGHSLQPCWGIFPWILLILIKVCIKN